MKYGYKEYSFCESKMGKLGKNWLKFESLK